MIFWCLLFSLPYTIQQCFFFLKITSQKIELPPIFFALLFSLFFSPFTKTAKFIYVIFHEISHIIPALLLKVEIKKIHISMESGFVECSKDNFLSRIFPYAVPLLPFLLLLIYWVTLGVYQVYFSVPTPIWLKYLYKGVIFWCTTVTTFWNAKLLWIGSTDIPEKNKWIALLLIAHSYIITTSFLLYWTVIT